MDAMLAQLKPLTAHLDDRARLTEIHRDEERLGAFDLPFLWEITSR